MDSGKAWVLYMKYPVRNAGLGLAFLYMTVLGFDNITYGYCLQQCVHESVLGTLVGVGAVIGVLGSISFPYLRKSLGLPRTGLIGMWLLVSTLTLCLSSIWLEGSPFKPDYFSATYNATLNQGFMKYNLTCIAFFYASHPYLTFQSLLTIYFYNLHTFFSSSCTS